MDHDELKKRWRVMMTAEQLGRLRSNRKFRAALLLGRVANAIRFAVRAGNEVRMQKGSIGARQRIGSYFVLSATVEELIKRVIPSVRAELSHVEGWDQLDDLIAEKTTAELRRTALARIRNEVAFHFSDEHIQRGLDLLPIAPYSVAHGDSSSILDVHFDFADRVAGAYATEDGSADLSQLLQDTSGLVLDLLIVLDTVVNRALDDLGLSVEVLDADA